jgi:hypothetical protein
VEGDRSFVSNKRISPFRIVPKGISLLFLVRVTGRPIALSSQIKENRPLRIVSKGISLLLLVRVSVGRSHFRLK